MKNPIKRFESEKKKNIKRLGQDNNLKATALKFLLDSRKYNYTYNFNWLGRPIIQIPQDVLAMQEIVWQVKPDFVIETGIAHGGSLIFYASLLELIGKGKVLGIDIDIREHNRKEIKKHKMFKRIEMIEGSSTDEKVIKEVKRIARGHKKILVCLDSLHSHSHVLRELELYSSFVSKGSYLVVFDTAIRYVPQKLLEGKDWSKTKNPASAVKAFLNKNKNFIADKEIENKILITVAPGGFLKRIV